MALEMYEIADLKVLCLGQDERDTFYRKVLFAITLTNLSQYVDKDTLQFVLDELNNMNAEQIQQCCDSLLEYNSQHQPYDLLRYYSLVKQSLVKQMMNPMKRMWVAPFIAGVEESVGILNPLSNSCPTDRFCLDSKVLDALKKFWHGDGVTEMDAFVPSDIFFSKQIAVHDMEIFLEKMDADGHGVEYQSRIKIHDSYDMLIDNATVDGLVCDKIIWIGYLDMRIPTFDGAGVVYIFGVIPGLDVVVVGDKGMTYGFSDSEFRDCYIANVCVDDVVALVTRHLQTWYTIQMTLLNPVLAEVVGSGRMMKDKRKRLAGKKLLNLNRKLKVRTVTMDDVNAVYENHPFVRKTMSWYVMGHWRHYKSGKDVFIAPYWKGPLKDMRSVFDPRVHEIDQNYVDTLQENKESESEKE